jgi:hypothetical protein
MDVVRQVVEEKITHVTDLALVREWYALARAPNTTLYDWMRLLERLEEEEPGTDGDDVTDDVDTEEEVPDDAPPPTSGTPQETYRVRVPLRGFRGTVMYERIVRLLQPTVARGRWHPKRSVVSALFNANPLLDRKEHQRNANVVWQWTNNTCLRERVADDSVPGLLMRQAANGRWMIRYN